MEGYGGSYLFPGYLSVVNIVELAYNESARDRFNHKDTSLFVYVFFLMFLTTKCDRFFRIFLQLCV